MAKPDSERLSQLQAEMRVCTRQAAMTADPAERTRLHNLREKLSRQIIELNSKIQMEGRTVRQRLNLVPFFCRHLLARL